MHSNRRLRRGGILTLGHLKMQMLSEMIKYKCWADRRTLDAVAAMGEVTTSSSAAFARQQLNHMVRVEELFKARLLDEPEDHQSTNTELIPDLQELDRRIVESNSWLAHYVDELTHSQLNEFLTFRFVDGMRGAMTRQEILFHLVNHGTYHRGAIGHTLDLAGAARPADTYTVFIHAAEPSRREMD